MEEVWRREVEEKGYSTYGLGRLGERLWMRRGEWSRVSEWNKR